MLLGYNKCVVKTNEEMSKSMKWEKQAEHLDETKGGRVRKCSCVGMRKWLHVCLKFMSGGSRAHLAASSLTFHTGKPSAQPEAKPF